MSQQTTVREMIVATSPVIHLTFNVIHIFELTSAPRRGYSVATPLSLAVEVLLTARELLLWERQVGEGQCWLILTHSPRNE